MNDSEKLDSLNCALDGVNLIEAAAGTGKTYNIQNLTVRLIVERGLPIEKILVVTYTEAAAAELADRIRRILQAVAGVAGGGGCPAAERDRAAALLDGAAARGIDRPTAAERLRTALRDFDDATISTIHGFCRRVLGEFAFESGVLFNARLETQPAAVVEPLCDDFFRRLQYADDPGGVRRAVLAVQKIDREQLRRTVALFLGRDGVAPHPAELPDPAEALEVLAEYLRQAREVYRSGQMMAFDGNLKGRFRTSFLQQMEERLTAFAASDAGTPVSAELLELLADLNSRTLLDNTLSPAGAAGKARHLARTRELLQAEFFQVTDRIAEWLPRAGAAIRMAGVGFVGAALERAKRQENFQTFDDLLLRVRAALTGTDRGALETALQAQYTAGIIDEFQDTDQVQYEIFERIFICRAAPALFMVGDPRQAIYAFRGGDIATYRRADRDRRAAGGRKYTLTANYRSAGALIAAVNRVFAEHRCPFADPAIAFPALEAPPDADGRERPSLRVNGGPDPRPLTIVRRASGTADAGFADCAAGIFELLNSDAVRLPDAPDRRLLPSDLAVLVATGADAAKMTAELRRYAIPSVFSRTGNVFVSPEAAELESVLIAVAAPHRLQLVIAALATTLCGLDNAALAALREAEDGAAAEAFRQDFARLGAEWREHSFLEMFSELLRRFRMRARLAALPGGERKLTNLLQLGDLLQQQERRRRLSPEGVLRFLAGRIAAGGSDETEEYKQLLETDRAAVTVMTIHGSKGLEFPVVFLPRFGAPQAADPYRPPGVYHNDDDRLEYDLVNDPVSQERAWSERLQELLRLAYVAITRARYRCTAYWYGSRGRTAAADWLFRMRDEAWRSDFLEALRKAPEEAIPPELCGEPPTELPAGRYRPDTGGRRTLRRPPAEPGIADDGWRITSFSALSPHGGPERPTDFDEADEDGEAGNGKAGGIMAIPGGAAIGSAWHRIFEIVDFAATGDALRRAAVGPLRSFGLLDDPETREERLQLTVGMVEAVLRAPLDCGTEVLRLAEIGPGDRLAELEFHYAFRHGFQASELRGILRDYARERFGLTEWPEWDFNLSGGYLNGFIDLVFRRGDRWFLLDWKSNRLRGDRRNFEPAGVTRAMARSFYFLQYLFYTVALVKYLRLRLGGFGEAEYETRFGGVFYCFLRGMSPERPGAGVFFEKPPWPLVARLEALIG